MAKADWVRIFGEKIEEAINNLDGDVLADDISEAVDWQELVRTAIAEDPDIRKKLKDKVAELVETRIKGVNDFDDLVGDDDFDWLGCLPKGEGVEDIVSKLLEPGGLLRKKLEEKITRLIEGDIDNTEDFEGLTGDSDFNWYEYLPDDWDIGKTIAELLESDEELKEKLGEKVQELFLARIDNLDNDDMPDWDDFLEILQIGERIREILGSSDELKEKLTNRIKELVDSRIQDGLDEDAIPADFLEAVDISAEVSQVLADRDFRAQVAEKLQGAIKSFIMCMVQGSGLGNKLTEKIEANPEFNSLLERQVGEIMRNPGLVSTIRSTIMERLAKDPAVGQKLMNVFFEEVARSLASKMIRDF